MGGTLGSTRYPEYVKLVNPSNSMYKTHQTETKKKELGGTLLLWPQRTGPSVLRGFLLHALDMQMVWPHLNLPWCWFWRRPHSQQEFPLSFTKLLTGPVGSTMRGLLRSLESFSDSQHKINWQWTQAGHMKWSREPAFSPSNGQPALSLTDKPYSHKP